MTRRTHALEPDALGCRLYVKVTPGARSEEIQGLIDLPDGPRLRVKVQAPPDDGRANEAVRRVLAKSLGIRASGIAILAGATSREKTLSIPGVPAAEAAMRLGLPPNG